MQRTQNKNQHQSSEIILDSGKIIKRKFDEAINQNQQTTEYISSNQSSNISNSSNLNKKIVRFLFGNLNIRKYKSIFFR